MFGGRAVGGVCGPDEIRAAAVRQYGSGVYAVIGFIVTEMPGGRDVGAQQLSSQVRHQPRLGCESTPVFG